MFSPKPKPVARVKSREIIDYVLVKRDGVCMWGLSTGETCTAGLDPHHIKSKGSGGDDAVENLITLCRGHHNDAHSGKIRRGKLRSVLEWYHSYVYTPEELEE